MSTKVKDSLHELIQSLSKSEKRYYKLFATRHTDSEESTMVLLFDYIARQPVYDEAALIRHFSGKAFLNQFATVKKRLYDHILQSLHAFHASNSAENQVNRMIHQAGLLYEKSLYDQCIRHLRSAEKLAIKHELFTARITINKLRSRILETRGYAGDTEQIDQQHEAISHALTSEQLLLDLWRTKSRLFQLLQRSGKAVSTTDHQAIDSLMTTLPAREYLKHYGSAEATYLYLHIHAAYYFAKNDACNSLRFTEQTITHLETHSSFSQERPNMLLSALTNACYLSEHTGKYDKSQHYLNRLKQLAKDIGNTASEDLRIKLFSSRYSIELNLLLLKGQFAEARQLSSEILSGMERFGDKIMPARTAFLLLQLAVAEIGSEHYSSALHRINTILNEVQPDEHESIAAATHLLNLVVHYELGNTDHLPYIIKRTQKLLKGTNRLGIFEHQLLQTMHKLSRVHTLDHPELFGELLAAIQHTEAGVKPQYLFDYSTWIAAKMSHAPYAEKMREKYRFLTSA